ncbi:unnamed protein product [Fusarium graminearum]|nr:unnamed protein product [Fusarium graminearum]
MSTFSLQSSFEAQMAEQYCPDAPTPGYLWDPILHVWRSPDSEILAKNYSHPTTYWRTYGRYAKRSQILGLIEHIRYDHAYELLNEGYEDDGRVDTRSEAAEALLLEVIARSEEDGDDDFGTDKDDDCEESSEDYYQDDYEDYDEDVEDLPG